MKTFVKEGQEEPTDDSIQETIDKRPLFSQLQEKKIIQEEQFKESIRLANRIRGLNDDEVDFLKTQSKLEKEKLMTIQMQEERELEQFRQQVAKVAPTVKKRKIVVKKNPIALPKMAVTKKLVDYPSSDEEQ